MANVPNEENIRRLVRPTPDTEVVRVTAWPGSVDLEVPDREADLKPEEARQIGQDLIDAAERATKLEWVNPEDTDDLETRLRAE